MEAIIDLLIQKWFIKGIKVKTRGIIKSGKDSILVALI